VGAEIAASPDTTVDLSGTVVKDDESATDDQMGTIAIEALGGLSAAADVDAYHEEPDGAVLFSADTTLSLGGGAVIAGPEDIVRHDFGTYSLEFDVSLEGVPVGANVDAVSRDAVGDLVISFDVDVDLPGGVVAADEDLVRFDGATWSMALDASSLALTPPLARALDLDAVDVLDGTLWAISFDTSGRAGGVTFADEDVLTLETTGPSLTLTFDGSVEHAGWSSANVDAVKLPEPATWSGLAMAIGLLGVLARSGRARSCNTSRKGSTQCCNC
jgi:hypothetical protein